MKSKRYVNVVWLCVHVHVYVHSNRGLVITKEDNRVPGWKKVPSWKSCTKSMGAVAKKLEYKQKRDNRRSPIAGEYTLVCVCYYDEF